jgi:hypothetical protein
MRCKILIHRWLLVLQPDSMIARRSNSMIGGLAVQVKTSEVDGSEKAAIGMVPSLTGL